VHNKLSPCKKNGFTLNAFYRKVNDEEQFCQIIFPMVTCQPNLVSNYEHKMIDYTEFVIFYNLFCHLQILSFSITFSLSISIY